MNKQLIVGCLILNCVPAFAVSNKSDNNKINFHLDALYLQPSSNNLKYAVFVSGNQPYQQSWHNQTINPGYSKAFAMGLNYPIRDSLYFAALDWLHVGTNDSSSAQASQSTDIATVQFVAPPYDVGPGVFGIKRADSTVKSNVNHVDADIGRVFQYDALKGSVFTGLSVVDINQNLTTTFSDYAGSPEVPGQAYALPADPDFYFTTKNTSDYLGVGPNLGVNLQYENSNGFGVIGQFEGFLTVGSMGARDDFTSSSRRLIDLGLSPSHQSITTPNQTQFVPGFESQLGLLYSHAWRKISMTIEGGYHFAYYMNAVSTIAPDTLVQARVDSTIPEFATGTMAINSTTSSTSPFSLRGPYLSVTIAIV